MSFKIRRLAALLAITVSVVAASGCRNPFLPSADIQISAVSFPDSTLSGVVEMPVFFAITPSYTTYRVKVSFWMRNKVDVNITSVNLFYTDLAGNPVTAYAASGGKTIKLMSRMYAPTSNNPDPASATGELIFYALDTQVYQALLDPTLSPKAINCIMTFRGEDANGYDIKLTAQFSIKGYGF